MTASAGYKMRRDSDGTRHKVVVWHGVEGYVVHWTSCCSGCTEVPEMTAAPEAGCGCHECGYTGKRRNEFWSPFDLNEWPIVEAAIEAARLAEESAA